MIRNDRDDLNELPCDCELPAPPTVSSATRRIPTEAPAVADVGHLPVTDRKRLYNHVLDIAERNGWTLHQAAEYADRLRANVVCLATARAQRQGRRG